MQSITSFFHTQYPATPFTRSFLDDRHLLQLQQQLTVALRYTSGNPSAPVVPFSELLVARIIDYAKKMKHVQPSPQQMRMVDDMFVARYVDDMTWESNYKQVWNRWCAEGIPDPNNIPLPIYGDKRDMTLDVSNYSLSHPFGTEFLPRY